VVLAVEIKVVEVELVDLEQTGLVGQSLHYQDLKQFK
jgi:hypothetical protein